VAYLLPQISSSFAEPVMPNLHYFFEHPYQQRQEIQYLIWLQKMEFDPNFCRSRHAASAAANSAEVAL